MVRKLYNFVKYGEYYHIGFGYYDEVNGRLENTGKSEKCCITEEELYQALEKANLLEEVKEK